MGRGLVCPLFLPPVVDGRDPIHERTLRPIVAEVEWAKQQKAWTGLRRHVSTILLAIAGKA